MRTAERGFTLIELLVVLGLFSIAILGFYTVMFSGRKGATTTQNIATVSQEARLGLNRMVRDAREATTLSGATATEFTIEIDFDGNGAFDPAAYEVVTYAYDSAGRRVTISNGTVTETLVGGVDPIAGKDMFTYGSNRLEYDTNNDGVTTLTELNAAATAGATLVADKLTYISSISFAMQISEGSSRSTFYTQAQLRNRR